MDLGVMPSVLLQEMDEHPEHVDGMLEVLAERADAARLDAMRQRLAQQLAG